MITLHGLLLVPLNGHWGRWAAWSACSTTCGKGYQTRSRMCDDPPPEFEGDICEGELVEVQMCKGNRSKCKGSNQVTGSSKLSLGCCFRRGLTYMAQKQNESPYPQNNNLITASYNNSTIAAYQGCYTSEQDDSCLPQISDQC